MTDSPFLWGGSGERMTPSQVERKRKVAQALMQEGGNYSPVQHWTQGLARVTQSLVGGLEERRANAAEKVNSAEDAGILMGLLGGIGGSPAPSAGLPAPADGVPPKPVSAPADLLPRFVQAEQQHGLPPNYLAQTANIESRFDPNAKNPNSSAAGLFQFTKGTARDYGLANPMDPIASTDAAARLAADNAKVLTRALGRAPTAGELYLAHQQGAGGASKLLANPNARAIDIVGAEALRLNGGHDGMTAGEFAKRWTSKLAANEADMPAPDAMPAEAPAGQPGFAVPLAEAPQPLPMSPQNFAAITSGAPPMEPAFQAEGASQPWMGTAIAPQPAAPQIAQAPMPPARPADLPAPGAVEAIGQMPPQQPAPANMGNIDHFGDRLLQVQSEEARQNQPAAPQAAGSPLERVAAAFTGGGQPAPAAAPQNPNVAKVAQAVAQNPSDPLVQALTSPYASEATKRVAMAMLTKKIESQTRPQWTEQTLPDGSLAQRNAQTGEMKIIRPGVNPLDAEGKKLDIETKKKNLGKAEAPAVQRVKQPDGSEVAVQWDQATGAWVPLKAPEGGNAVKAPGKLTEQQSKDVGFYNRGSKIVDRLDTQDAALKDTLSALGGNVSNYLKSDAYRQAEQTGRELLAVILRKDTGAAVTDKEMELYGNIYLPKPGDDDQTVMQKRFARRNAMEGLKMGLGPAEILFNSQNTPMPAQQGAAPSGQTKSGVKWSVE